MFKFIIGVLVGIAISLGFVIVYDALFVARGDFSIINNGDDGEYIGVAFVSKITGLTKKIILTRKNESR